MQKVRDRFCSCPWYCKQQVFIISPQVFINAPNVSVFLQKEQKHSPEFWPLEVISVIQQLFKIHKLPLVKQGQEGNITFLSQAWSVSIFFIQGQCYGKFQLPTCLSPGNYNGTLMLVSSRDPLKDPTILIERCQPVCGLWDTGLCLLGMSLCTVSVGSLKPSLQYSPNKEIFILSSFGFSWGSRSG